MEQPYPSMEAGAPLTDEAGVAYAYDPAMGPIYGMDVAAAGGFEANPEVGLASTQADHYECKPRSASLVLIPLCRKGDRAGIERQLQAGASVHETDFEGNTPLHVAVEAPRNEIATVQCLLENGAHTNAVNYLGAAPLHYVCLRRSNYRGVANILLETGANINCQTLAGLTPLHFACKQQLPELVETLCLFAADTNLLDHDGCAPIHLTLGVEGGRDTVKRQIIGHLIQYQARLHQPNCQGFSPLHLACRWGHVRCVHCLIENHADVQGVTTKGMSCLHLACAGGHVEVAQFLLSIYPNSVDMVDSEGSTALHICAVTGSLDCAVCLLKMDANTSIKNNAKKTAFDLAKIRGTDLNNTHNPELVQVLKDAQKGHGCRQS
mmetsp:Transcript_14119/g.38700  ORF Transcript_14119/g.38700 Transcript_14119/m.38700 type:complete len:379 (+) Transcript_14119:215-1351(+)